MNIWAQQQIKDAAKAFELRIREATSLASAYSAGEITPEKASELQSRYYHRWGEALPGVSVTDTMTDKQILADVDKAAEFASGPFVSDADSYTGRVARSRTPSDPSSREPS